MCVRGMSYTGSPTPNVWFLCNSVRSEERNTVLFPTIQNSIPVSFAGQKKHTCTYQVDVVLEGQTRSWGQTLHLSFSHTGERALIPVLIQGFFHVFNEAKGNLYSNYFKMLRQFILPLVWKEGVQECFWGSRRRSLFLRFDRGEGYCLSTERASKQTNKPVSTSEDHIDCKVNKKKAQEQGSTGTPSLALSAVTGLESLSVLSAAPAASSRHAAHRKQQLSYQAVKPVTHRSQNIQLSSLLTWTWLQDQGHTSYFMMAAALIVVSLWYD